MTRPTTEFVDLQRALAGEYSLQRELGRGASGAVYLAREVQLDRDVAIKVLPERLARVPAERERFLREARTAAALSHPHIVPIHRVGEGQDVVFFVMSYVEGETLGERLRRQGPLPAAEALRMLREVAWALAYAHGRGVVHRDIKPDNILLEAGTGRALVTDFGIAQRDAEPVGAAGANAVADRAADRAAEGTAPFMSPEQAAREAVDGRSDLYALGVVGYLAVHGRFPEAPAPVAGNAARSRGAASSGSVGQGPGGARVARSPGAAGSRAVAAAPVRTVAAGVPAALANAIDRCLAPDPTARFPDAEALAEALAPTMEARPALPATLRGWLAARNPLVLPYMAWSGGLGVLTLGNIVAWLTGNPGSSPHDFIILAAAASLPLLPIVGFHLNQARLQFRAGHSLADLRSAIEIERREQAETEVVMNPAEESTRRKFLRTATLGSATWLGVTFGLVVQGAIHESNGGVVLVILPVLSTMLFGAVSNALDVQFIPTGVRKWWQTGLRDRLWESRAGKWLAGKLGAPEHSSVAGPSTFRATEAALGVAATELFAALPALYREQLRELPAMVTALEAHAAEARAEIELVAALAPSGSADADALRARRDDAQAHLARSVAALERIRLDLLRLHGSVTDLAPRETLMHDAQMLAQDLSRLAEAHREVEDGSSAGP